jgi:predicted transcriptional regulator
LGEPAGLDSAKRKAKFCFAKGIVTLISEGVSNEAAIAHKVGRSRQFVHYYLVRLERGGYIERTTRKKPWFFEVTERGRQSFLDTYEVETVRWQPLLRLHNCRWAFPVVRGVVDISKATVRWKTVHMAGWDCFYGRALGVAFRYLPSSNVVEVYDFGLMGSDADDLERQSLLRTVEFSRYLEGALKVRFGCPRPAGKFHLAILNDPLAPLFKKTVSVGDVWVDCSKGKPELESRDKKLLEDYLFMVQNFPMVVESLKKMDPMLENQKRLSEQVAALNELLNQKPKPFNRELQRLYES